MSRPIDVITVVNGIGPTSMPYNEFALYRSRIGTGKSYVLVCGEQSDFKAEESVTVRYVGKSASRMVAAVAEICEEAKRDGHMVVAHLHHPRAALRFLILRKLRRFSIPCVFTVHSLFHSKNYNLPKRFLSRASGLLADKVVCVSSAAYDDYSRIVKAIRSRHITVVSNGVDIERIDKCASRRSSSSIKKGRALRLVYVARMIPVKNHAFLFEIMKQLPFCELYLIGEKASVAQAKQNASEVQSRVHYLGILQRDEVYSILPTMDVYVSSSMVEGLPVSILEAMGASLPVLASAIKPHIEVLSGCDGAFVLPLDQGEWISCLSSLNEDLVARKDLGDTCRRYVEEHYSLRAMTNDYEFIYKSLVGVKDA